MEEVTHRDHLHLHQRTTTASIYLVLGIILILPLLWQAFGNDTVRKWHPFREEEYSLYWYIALLVYNLKPLLYLIVARLTKPRYFTLIYVFIGYECILFLDHVLIYSQSPGIVIGAMVMAVYMVWYFFKYK